MGFLDWLSGNNNQGVSDFEEAEPFRIRAVPQTVNHDGYQFPVWDIQVRGYLPVPRCTTDCSICVHMLDITKSEAKPVFYNLEDAQETRSGAIELLKAIGPIEPGDYLTQWVSLYPVVLEAMYLPFSGLRRLAVVAHLVPTQSPPRYNYGFRISDDDSVFAESIIELIYKYNDIGYVEASENRKRVQELTIQLGFYIAASDRSLDAKEAMVIRNWGDKIVKSYSSDGQEDTKKWLNTVINKTYRVATGLNLELDEIVAQINKIASDREKYEALELCLDVMSADGLADPAELRELDKMSGLLGVDRNKFRALQDKRLTQVTSISNEGDDLGQLIGITPDMDKGQIRKHLTAEYRKWNSRATSPDPKIKEKAEEMNLLIGKARNLYLGEKKTEQPRKPVPKKTYPHPKIKQGTEGIQIKWKSREGRLKRKIFVGTNKLDNATKQVRELNAAGFSRTEISKSIVKYDQEKGWR